MDDATRALIADAVNHQLQSTVTVLSSLLAVEDAIGYVPPEAVEAVAARMDATINDVWAVATFYPNFRFEPPTAHRIEVCWGPSLPRDGGHRRHRRRAGCSGPVR